MPRGGNSFRTVLEADQENPILGVSGFETGEFYGGSSLKWPQKSTPLWKTATWLCMTFVKNDCKSNCPVLAAGQLELVRGMFHSVGGRNPALPKKP